MYLSVFRSAKYEYTYTHIDYSSLHVEINIFFSLKFYLNSFRVIEYCDFIKELNLFSKKKKEIQNTLCIHFI